MYGNQPMWRFLSLRIAVFALDLMRWSQLTAALSIWGFMIIVFLALAFVTAEQQGADPLGIIFELLFRLPQGGLCRRTGLPKPTAR